MVDDLWLNELFAEWACYHAAVENTAFTESWTWFTSSKNWALREDQLPSTYPVPPADNYDLEAVEVNFDGITYAKGASVLKQLVFWVGVELPRRSEALHDHEYANAQFGDLLSALERSGCSARGVGRRVAADVRRQLPPIELDADGDFLFAVADRDL